MTEKEIRLIDENRKEFEDYCIQLEGYKPLINSPNYERLAKAFIAWSAAREQEYGKRS